MEGKDNRVRRGDTAEAYPFCLENWRSAENADAAVRAARRGGELLLHVCDILTPFESRITLSFTEHGTVVRGRRNVGFGGVEYEMIGIRK